MFTKIKSMYQSYEETMFTSIDILMKITIFFLAFGWVLFLVEFLADFMFTTQVKNGMILLNEEPCN